MKISRKVLSILLSVLMFLPVFAVLGLAEETAQPECEHEYQVTIIAPTCVEAGYKLYVCTKCGHSYRDYSDSHPALGHNFGEWVEIDKATCTEEGHMKRVCTRCGAAEVKTISVLGHVDADYDGRCDRCGAPVEHKPVFSPYDWFKALWAAIVNWFNSLFA